MYLWWSFCTLYLHACQLRVTIGNSGLCCCTCVTYFERRLTSLLVDSASALWALLCFRFVFYQYFFTKCIWMFVEYLEVSTSCLTMATAALFSASEHTHCTLVVCYSEWMTVALHSVFWASTEVVTALYSCYMTGAMWNCCRLGACSVYTIQPCTSLQCHFIQSHILRIQPCTSLQCHFIQSHILRMQVCLAVNLPPALLAEWAGSFTCCCNTGMEGILK